VDSIEVQLSVNPVVLRMMENAPDSRQSLKAGSTVADLLAGIGLGPRSSRLLLSVNGRLVSQLTPLAEGDRVAIMPVLGGG
jgi:sulfur carrier protein ThiS